VPTIRHGEWKVMGAEGRREFSVTILHGLRSLGTVSTQKDNRWAPYFVQTALDVLGWVGVPDPVKSVELLYEAMERPLVSKTTDFILLNRLKGHRVAFRPYGYDELRRAVRNQRGIGDVEGDADGRCD